MTMTTKTTAAIPITNQARRVGQGERLGCRNDREKDRMAIIEPCLGAFPQARRGLYRHTSGGWALRSLSALKITSNDTPISAAMAAQSDANPMNVSTTKSALTTRDSTMF